MKTVILVLVLVAWLPTSTVWAQAEGQTDLAKQAVIAQDLASLDRDRRLAGFDAAAMIPREQRSSAINAAMVQAMINDREDALAIVRGEAAPREWDASHDAGMGIIREVVALNDPATIPALLRVMGGVTVARALVRFGKPALPGILRLMEDPATLHHEEMRGGLITLRWMVQVWTLSHFTSAELAAMRDVADRYLDPLPSIINSDSQVVVDYLIYYAAALAYVLEDAILIEKALAIVRDNAALAERGLTDGFGDDLEWARERLRKKINDMLAGEPILPTYER